MKEEIIGFTAEAGEEGARLDMAMAARFPTISRSTAQKLIKAGAVKVDGRIKPPGFRLLPGMVVSAVLPDVPDAAPRPENGNLDILYEDDFILIINKKAGLVVHPGVGHGSGTLVNLLLASGRTFSSIGGADRPGLVHRLDKDTSGAMVIAKDDTTHTMLTDMFRDRTVHKTYLALVLGPRIDDHGLIETGFARRTGDRKQFTGKVADGKPAVTEFKTLLRSNLCALVAAWPKTGRTHQIRVHLAESGHPVVGDRVYGRAWPRRGSKPEWEVEALEIMKRHALHAYRIEFTHPRTGAGISVTAPLPPDFSKTLQGVFGDEWIHAV
ncbi:MAG TPA: RluA family pseudouridine synthase [Myxococcota bacterium]|nr:RluA family pseudouridine synthase [Myxococcota bacterium]